MSKNKNLKQNGFTLVELMVVVAIIAILAIIGLTVYQGLQRNARNAKRRADVEAISRAYEVHYNDTVNSSCPTGPAGTYCAAETNWFAGNAIPKDPSTGAEYVLPTNLAVGDTGAPTYSICVPLEPASGPIAGSCLAESLVCYCRANQQ